MAELTSIIDRIIDAPEGLVPSKLHVLFDKKTRGYADQYETALQVARNIPFDSSKLSVTDPLVMIVANVFRITDGQQALVQAQQYYNKWALDAKKHGWMLALLADNDFVGEPEPYPAPDAPPPGIPIIPEPKYNILNPTERRLKQMIDYLDSDDNFQQTVMTAVNDAMVKLVNEVEETDPVTTFHVEPTSSDLHGETSANDNPNSTKSRRRNPNKDESLGAGTVGDNSTESPSR